MLIKAHPIVHLAFFDVADNVVDRFEANRIEGSRTVAVRIERLVARREDAVIAVAIDEGVSRVAIGLDGSQLVDTGFILQERGRRHGDGAARDGAFKSGRHVIYLQSDVLNTVAVQNQALALRMIPRQRRSQNESDVPLAQNVTRLVPQPRLQPRIGDDIETKGVSIKVSRLPRIPNKKPNMIDAPQGQNIL